jgi:hypothetical protein
MRLALRFLPFSALLACAAACTTLRPVQPDQLTSLHSPARVWVTRADHSVAVFDSARVESDSLVGVVNGQPQRVALVDITMLRARERSGERTAALMLFGASVGTALVVDAMATNQGPGKSSCPAVNSGSFPVSGCPITAP